MSDELGRTCRDGRDRMRRRDLLAAVAAASGAITLAQIARAQERRLPTIGYLSEGSLANINGNVDEFRKGLAEMGYTEGRNVAIEFREAHNDLTRLRELARDLVRLQVDVIVTPGSGAATKAARAATDTIPIVFSNSGDPITSGLIEGLSHPGGNVTGISDFGDGLSVKRLEFLKLLAPAVSVVALLIRASNPGAATYAAAAREPARLLGIDTFALPIGNAEEIDAAFATIAEGRADGFCIIPNVLFVNRGKQILDLAMRYRVLGVYPVTGFVQRGGLMSYGSSAPERNYQTGIYTGRILNGTKPADLPVRRLTSFELAINMKTAKTLGLAVPARFLALADKVIA
jgi:putative ABC transport system substrate-binding protein